MLATQHDEPFEPNVHGFQVAERVDRGVHRGDPSAIRAGGVAALAELRVRGLERSRRLARIAELAAHATPIRKPRLALDQRLGHPRNRGPDRREPAFGRVQRRQLAHEPCHGAPLSAIGVSAERIIACTGELGDFRGTPAQRRQSRRSERLASPREQELAKQWMVLIRRRSRRALLREVMLPNELGQQRVRSLLSRQLLRHRGIERRRQQRRTKQKVPDIGGAAVEDLAREVIEQSLCGRRIRRRMGRRGGRRGLERQQQPCEPPVALPVQLRGVLPRGLASRACGQKLREPDRLVLAEPQRLPVEQRQLPVQLQSRERVGGADAAHDDDVRSGRQLFQSLTQDFEERPAAHLLNVVEHEHERRRETARDLAEEIARERRQAAHIFRREPRHRCSIARCRFVDGQREIVKETRGIPIAAIDVIPNAPACPLREPGQHQRRLAGAWRTFDPDPRSVGRRRVEARKKPGTLEDAPQAGWSQLRKGRSRGRFLIDFAHYRLLTTSSGDSQPPIRTQSAPAATVECVQRRVPSGGAWRRGERTSSRVTDQLHRADLSQRAARRAGRHRGGSRACEAAHVRELRRAEIDLGDGADARAMTVRAARPAAKRNLPEMTRGASSGSTPRAPLPASRARSTT